MWTSISVNDRNLSKVTVRTKPQNPTLEILKFKAIWQSSVGSGLKSPWRQRNCSINDSVRRWASCLIRVISTILGNKCYARPHSERFRRFICQAHRDDSLDHVFDRLSCTWTPTSVVPRLFGAAGWGWVKTHPKNRACESPDGYADSRGHDHVPYFRKRGQDKNYITCQA